MTILRDIAIRYQFLDSKVQSTISTRSRLLSPFSFDEQEIQPNIIRKANQLRSLMFGNVQLFDLLKIPGGTAHIDSLLNAEKTKESSEFFTYEWFSRPNKLNHTDSPFCESCYKNLPHFSNSAMKRNLTGLKWSSLKYHVLEVKTIRSSESVGKIADFLRLFPVVQ